MKEKANTPGLLAASCMECVGWQMTSPLEVSSVGISFVTYPYWFFDQKNVLKCYTVNFDCWMPLHRWMTFQHGRGTKAMLLYFKVSSNMKYPSRFTTPVAHIEAVMKETQRQIIRERLK